MLNEIVVPSISKSSIKISGYDNSCRESYECDIHFHQEYEILQMLNGITEFHIYGQDYVVDANDIIFVNSRVPHSTTVHKDSSGFFVQFRTDIFPNDSGIYLSKYLSQFINIANEDLIIFKAGTKLNLYLSSLLESIRQEFMQKEPSYDVFIKGNMYNILALLYREKIVMNPETYFDSYNFKKIVPVLEYIDENYYSQITLAELCKLVNLNEYYFCRLFKKAVNTSVVQYLNFVRVCKAERFLTSTDKSISEIAYETGFSSVSYFNRIFKKYKNCTPGTYKNYQYGLT